MSITYDTYHQYLEKRFWLERNPVRTPQQDQELIDLVQAIQQYEAAKIKPQS